MEKNPEVETIIPLIPQMLEEGKKFYDLPLVNSGCDTYAAVYPEFKDFSPMMTVEQVVDKIKDVSPMKFGNNNHLVITGGEPLLPGWQKVYPDILEKLYFEHVDDLQLLHVTFETNGTQKLLLKSLGELGLWFTRVHFSVSVKLSASGEPKSKTIVPEAIDSYFNFTEDLDFKFVVDSEEHIDEINDLFNNELRCFKRQPIYLMPEGGTNEAYSKNKIKVANMALKYGFRFSPRLQCEISDNSWGT
jgi:organic radical activating enzyme